ncbi:hypothetical protein [Chitinophaga sp. GbtcB8]|uniref:hypothetical protein n=1 Tax=Chitinophaga sp. GbtcB8 TaxID=2824753 RepID=UPI001C2FA57A|nr:hypothetical protein [Chitinophaga sp. GbtcB8]
MAQPNIELIAALRETAKRLKNGAPYAWGNHGTCNCGNLLQVVTNLSKDDILYYAQTGIGEWTELAEEYCVVSNAPVAMLITRLLEKGLTPTDIHNIEYLQDRDVLDRLPGGFRWLKRNQRDDVVVYLETFATLLEDKLLQQVEVPYKQWLQPVGLTYS